MLYNNKRPNIWIFTKYKYDFNKILWKSIRKFIIEISKSTNKILIPDIPESITIPKELEDKTEFIGPLLHKNPQEIDTKENLRRKYGLDNNEKFF